MTAHIDKAVEEIERRREAAGRGVEYKAFEMYFMQGMDYAEIAEQLDTGKNTPRRWVTGIINELSVLLWGIDEVAEVIYNNWDMAAARGTAARKNDSIYITAIIRPE